MARYITLRVRLGVGVHYCDEEGTRLLYAAGDEFTIPYSKAAGYLRGKNRRLFDVVEVFDDESGGKRHGSRSGESLN